LEPKERKLFKTNLAMAIPDGYYGRIAPRSGYAFKYGIDVLAGVIDSGYRNEIGVILYNTGEEPFIVNKGTRIAQMIFEKCYKVSFVHVEKLPESQRGLGGFGSSNI
jgi:dUTP pyrophosphatase